MSTVSPDGARPSAVVPPVIPGEPADLRLVAVAATAWAGVLLGGAAAPFWPTVHDRALLGGAAGLAPGGTALVALLVGVLLLAAVRPPGAGRRRPPRPPRRTAGGGPDGPPDSVGMATGGITGPGGVPHPGTTDAAATGRTPRGRSVSGRDGLCWLLVLCASVGCGLTHTVTQRTGPLAVLGTAGATMRSVAAIRGVPSPLRSGAGAPGTVLVVVGIEGLENVRSAPDEPLVDIAVRGDVSVLAPASWAQLPVGERVRARLRLQRAPTGRRVQAWAQALGPPERLARPDRLDRAVDRVRDGLVRSCRGLPQPARGLVPAVVDGDTRGVSTATTSDMRVSGLLHLSAVSGENVAILVATVVGLLGLLRVGRVATMVASLAAVGGFALLADQAPSVLRAGLTATLGLLGARAGGRGTGLRTLAATATLLVLLEPDLGTDAGFVLSVGATAAILVASSGIGAALAGWLPRPVATALAVSLTAQLGAQPVLGALSGQLSLVGPLANLLAAPAVAPVTVLGLLAAVVAPLAPAVSTMLVWAAAPGAWWLAALANACAHLPGAAIDWPAGWIGAGCAVVLGAFGLWAGPTLVAHRSVALPAAGILIGIVAGPLVLPR